MARARRAVLCARARLAACELSEQVSRMRLYRLKVKRVQKELEDADTGVGRICEQIRRSGQSLHHSPILRKSMRRHSPCKFLALLLIPFLTCADIEYAVNDEFYVDLQ